MAGSYRQILIDWKWRWDRNFLCLSNCLPLRPFITGTIAVSLSHYRYVYHWARFKRNIDWRCKYFLLVVVITMYFDEIKLTWPHVKTNCSITVVPAKLNLFQPENIDLQIWKIVTLVRQSTSIIILKHLGRWNKKSTQQFSRPKVISTKLQGRVHVFLQVLISVKIVWIFRFFFQFLIF